jgi:hypothetical protein
MNYPLSFFSKILYRSIEESIYDKENLKMLICLMLVSARYGYLHRATLSIPEIPVPNEGL